jgi:hypothetical protein
MQFRQRDQFPYCDHYLQHFLAPDMLKQRQQVWDAFRFLCESDSLATEGVTYGKGPLVVIGCAPPGRQGRYWARQKTVFIHPKVALLYEKHTHRQPRVWERAKEKFHWFDWMPWESTVLHEIVHWARDVGGKPEKFNDLEAGDEFEKRAYGRTIDSAATLHEESECQFDPTPPWRSGQ